MLQTLSKTQKVLTGILAVVAVVGWVFAFLQVGRGSELEAAVEKARQRISAAKAEAEQAKSALELVEQERSQLLEEAAAAGTRQEASGSLEEVATQVEAGKAELAALQAQIEALRAEAAALDQEVEQRQALLQGGNLQFKTNSRARVRSGPGTDTAEVAVVPAGRTIEVYEIVEDGTWYRVGGMGYIFHELLDPVDKKVAQ